MLEYLLLVCWGVDDEAAHTSNVVLSGPFDNVESMECSGSRAPDVPVDKNLPSLDNTTPSNSSNFTIRQELHSLLVNLQSSQRAARHLQGAVKAAEQHASPVLEKARLVNEQLETVPSLLQRTAEIRSHLDELYHMVIQKKRSQAVNKQA